MHLKFKDRLKSKKLKKKKILNKQSWKAQGKHNWIFN